jgi:hypothetical protein
MGLGVRAGVIDALDCTAGIVRVITDLAPITPQ